MKSLRALVIVIIAGLGMIASLVALMRYRWPDHMIRGQFEKASPAEFSRVELKGNVPNGVVSIGDQKGIERFIEAFKRADRPRSGGEKNLSIVFVYNDERPPLKYDCGTATLADELGPSVANAVEPYLREPAPVQQ